MKKVFYFLVSCLLVVGLHARENPFESTDTYKEKQIEYLKELELEQMREKKLQEQMEMQEQVVLEKEKEIEDLETLKQEELRKIEELKAQRAMIEKEQQQKLLQIKKQKLMAQKNKYNVLPFVHVDTTADTFTLYVDTKFKLINQDVLKKQKKILYDFKGYASFYTIKKALKNDAFKSFAVGTHRNKGFFRVVVDLTDNTSKYNEIINTKEGKIVIVKKN